jgi:hypothetical protein
MGSGLGSKNNMTFDYHSSLWQLRSAMFSYLQSLRTLIIPAHIRQIRNLSVGPQSQNFAVEGDLLLTADGAEIVRYFGREFNVIVPAKVEVLRKSYIEE